MNAKAGVAQTGARVWGAFTFMCNSVTVVKTCCFITFLLRFVFSSQRSQKRGKLETLLRRTFSVRNTFSTMLLVRITVTPHSLIVSLKSFQTVKPLLYPFVYLKSWFILFYLSRSMQETIYRPYWWNNNGRGEYFSFLFISVCIIRLSESYNVYFWIYAWKDPFWILVLGIGPCSMRCDIKISL